MALRRRGLTMRLYAAALSLFVVQSCAAALLFAATHSAQAASERTHATESPSRAPLRVQSARHGVTTRPASTTQKTSKPPADPPDSPPAPLCRTSDLTIGLPDEFLPLHVTSNSFISTNNSAAVLTLQNGYPQPIDEIGLVIEYTDEQNKILFSTVFAASANNSSAPSWFAQNLPSQYAVLPWSSPVAPGKTFTIGSTSGITVAQCPAQAKVTLVHLVFEDGSTKDWGAPGWQLPVQPQEIPGPLRISAPSKTLPQRFLIRVHVPAPIGPIIPPPVIDLIGGRRTSVFDQIKEQVQDWRFWFKLRNGAAVDGEETLLVRVHSPREARRGDIFRLKPAEVSEPMGIIDVVPRKGSLEWNVYYGGVNLAAGPPVLSQR